MGNGESERDYVKLRIGLSPQADLCSEPRGDGQDLYQLNWTWCLAADLHYSSAQRECAGRGLGRLDLVVVVAFWPLAEVLAR